MSANTKKRRMTVKLLDCLNTGENNISSTNPLTFGKLALNDPSNTNNQISDVYSAIKNLENQVSSLGNNNLRVVTAVTLDGTSATSLKSGKTVNLASWGSVTSQNAPDAKPTYDNTNWLLQYETYQLYVYPPHGDISNFVVTPYIYQTHMDIFNYLNDPTGSKKGYHFQHINNNKMPRVDFIVFHVP